MTTYKQFLIYDNFRCYLDNNGRLDPMFPYTEFETIDQVKARIDKYWQEWEQWQTKRKADLSKSFEILKADIDHSDEAREIDRDRFEDKMNQYYEREHWFGND